jgi:hypothetical protein
LPAVNDELEIVGGPGEKRLSKKRAFQEDETILIIALLDVGFECDIPVLMKDVAEMRVGIDDPSWLGTFFSFHG